MTAAPGPDDGDGPVPGKPVAGRAVEIVGCHAEGEVGDVIVGGIEPPPGATLWEQARWIAADETLRNFVLNEPRGGVFRHVNLLVPATRPEADAAFIIMEPVHTPPMSGSNSICVATVLLETGRVSMVEPVTELTLEAPGGLVSVSADCHGGRVRQVTVTNVASFVDQRDAVLEVEGFGSVRVDTAYGGDSFVLVDAADVGFGLEPDEAADLAAAGTKFSQAATEQLGFVHPTQPDWDHVSFCQFAGPLNRTPEGLWSMRNTVAIEPGKLDRSPTGTGVSARLALLHAQGRVDVGHRLEMWSIIGSRFEGEIVEATSVGQGANQRPAVVPRLSGRAWITGQYSHVLDPEDPWPTGYRVGDTWPSR